MVGIYELSYIFSLIATVFDVTLLIFKLNDRIPLYPLALLDSVINCH